MHISVLCYSLDDVGGTWSVTGDMCSLCEREYVLRRKGMSSVREAMCGELCGMNFVGIAFHERGYMWGYVFSETHP